jgi:4-carboxymuconolactone decarboxylase
MALATPAKSVFVPFDRRNMQSIRSALCHAARLGALAAVLGYPALLSAQQPRFPQLKLEDTSGDQRAMADRMLKETRVGLGGPWNVMLRSPTVAQGMMDVAPR